MAVLSNTGIRAGASGAGGSGYQIKKSIRLEGDDSASLKRTFSAGDKKKWTYSYWMRRNNGRGHWYNSFLWAGASLTGNLRFDDPNTNQMYGILASGVTMNTTRRFRDFSAWMHVVVVWDSNNTTAGDRFRLYINGVRETSFTSISAISEGLDSAFNGNEIHGIGVYNSNTGLTCYIADVYFVDGYAKEPSDFGKTDEDTGEWVPKEYEDSLVEFSESTASGFSYWAGMADDWDDSGDTESGTNDYINRALPSDSKVYWEVTINNAGTYRNFGLQTGTGGLGEGYNDSTVGYYYNGNPPLFMVSGGGGGNGITHGSSTGTTWEDGKKLMFAWDPTGGGSTGKLYLGYDGTWYNSGNPSCGTGAVLTGMNTSSSWYLKTGYNNGGGSMTFTNVASGSAEWLPGSCTTTYHKNSCHLKFEGTDLGADSSGNDNNWTVDNITQGLHTISSPNLPTWDQADSGWAKSNSDKNGTYSGTNAYAQIVTGALTDDTTYHFFLVKDDADATGGWFFADTQTPTDTHPDQLEGNSLGLRTTETGIGTWGTYATANSTSSAENQITGFESIDDKKCDIEFVVNRTVDKVWLRRAGDTGWLKGGDPTNTSSTPTFALPDGDTIYFGHVGYNNPTTVNFSDTAGAAMDIDVSSESPTNYDDGANGGGTYCTWNPAHSQNSLVTYTQGNLKLAATASSGDSAKMYGFGTMACPAGGKWYWEDTGLSNRITGISADPLATGTYSWVGNNGVGNSVSGTATGAATAITTSDCIGIALDTVNWTVTYYKNGVEFYKLTGINQLVYHPWCGVDSSSSASANHSNFGAQTFKYTPPTGYKALNTYNLADPTITNPGTGFDTQLWTGNATDDRDIDGYSFSPDLVWIKERGSTGDNHIFDTVRGANIALRTNVIDAEGTTSDELKQFNSDGFRLGTGGDVNASGTTTVGWAWDAGTANVSKSAGDYNSTTYDTSEDWSANTSNDAGNTTDPGQAFRGMISSTGVAVSTSFVNLTDVAFDVTSTISLWIHDAAGIAVTIEYNGTEYTNSSPTKYGWTDFTVPSGSNSGTLKVKLASSGDECRGVKIDGKILVDSNVTPPNLPSIATTYRANPNAGFSIVTATASSSSGETMSIAHGLNAKPNLIIGKDRDHGDVNWAVYHSALGAGNRLHLDADSSVAANANYWSNTEPSSEVFYTNSGSWMYTSADTVFYCWSEVSGYSKFGNFTGNGSTEGIFIWCGFRPAWVMFKRTNMGYGWNIYDSKRDPYNEPDVSHLHAEASNAEVDGTEGAFDMLSNGFKMRGDHNINNASGGEYVFAAFAESPFKYSNAR